jgi:phage-related protein
MATQYTFAQWNGSVQYEKYDVARGTSAPDTTYFYGTQDSLGVNPRAVYSYSSIVWNRKDDLITVHYTLTGIYQNFVQGSIITAIGGLVNGFTGMIVNAGQAGATSGFLQFIHAGWNESNNTTAGTISTFLSPQWTTGFFFVPSYNTNIEVQPIVIESKFGDGYSQRQAENLNNNNVTWDLNFDGRSDKEARAILNFVEDKAGVYPFELLLPVNKFVNRPELKYITKSARVGTNSFGLNNVSVSVQQVFDL